MLSAKGSLRRMNLYPERVSKKWNLYADVR
jgi:hypothetical protein